MKFKLEINHDSVLREVKILTLEAASLEESIKSGLSEQGKRLAEFRLGEIVYLSAVNIERIE